MTNQAKKLSELLHDLAARMSDHPENVAVAVSEAKEGGAFFEMTCDLLDERVLVGRGGSHVRAMGFIVERIGIACGREFVFSLKTTGHPVPKDEKELNTAKDHDPKESVTLLKRALVLLNVRDCEVTAERSVVDHGMPVLVFKFWLAPRSDVSRMKLLAQNGDRIPFYAAFALLFRAIGLRDGVEYNVQIRKLETI